MENIDYTKQIYNFYKNILPEKQKIRPKILFDNPLKTMQKERSALKNKGEYIFNIYKFYSKLKRQDLEKINKFFKKNIEIKLSKYIFIADIPKDTLPWAAGVNSIFENIDISILANSVELPAETILKSILNKDTFGLYLQCELPIKLLFIFFDNDKLLQKIEVNELIPGIDKMISYDKIKNFTLIRILRIN